MAGSNPGDYIEDSIRVAVPGNLIRQFHFKDVATYTHELLNKLGVSGDIQREITWEWGMPEVGREQVRSCLFDVGLYSCQFQVASNIQGRRSTDKTSVDLIAIPAIPHQEVVRWEVKVLKSDYVNNTSVSTQVRMFLKDHSEVIITAPYKIPQLQYEHKDRHHESVFGKADVLEKLKEIPSVHDLVSELTFSTLGNQVLKVISGQ